MRLDPPALLQLLLALGALLVVAHAGGLLFARLRQPRVIGEILGGLLLGPTVLGRVAPGLAEGLFGQPTTAPILGAVYELGLLLLMYLSGLELRTGFPRSDRRTAAWLSVVGTVVPFALGLLMIGLADVGPLMGVAGNRTALVLVVGAAVAVTSIPVISRIMLDLGIIETGFARVVLTVAVLEDIVLYAVVSVALGLVATGAHGAFGVPAWLGLEAGSPAGAAYHAGVTVGLFGLAVLAFRPMLTALRGATKDVEGIHPLAFHLLVMLGMTALALLLGVAPMFGAFVAGIAASRSVRDGSESHMALRQFSFAFFIPMYFALVGLRLDLFGAFHPVFTLGFLAYACAAKSVSVYAGARLAGEAPRAAVNLAVALNARGGPGIVLASIAYDAGIIAPVFYTALILLAVVTSFAAGSWLDAQVRQGHVLR